MSDKVNIRRLKTGIPGLDTCFGGGLPEFSFNLIAGVPGAGKTTLAHQLMFSMADTHSRALFFTVLGEPTLKMLRYQQQFAFFDFEKMQDSIRHVSLAEAVRDGDYDRALARIIDEVKAFSPSFVFVDSFRSIVEAGSERADGPAGLRCFVQRLAMQMTSWQATTFLVAEYMENETQASPVYTIADGIILLTKNARRNSVVRKLQVVKMRGQANSQGVHTFRIDDSGIQVFPRAMVNPQETKSKPAKISANAKRLSMGVPALDNMLDGGVPAGYSVLLVGPSGSGKTVLATEFLAEGVRNGETGVIAAFEKSPNQLLSQKLDDMVQSGHVGVVDTQALDLSIDETLHDLVAEITRLNAKRVVIDSLSGFELALAPEFQEDFRESLYRMVAVLTGLGVTVLMTTELEDRYLDLRFSPYGSAFLSDAIILQRYVEIAGELKRIISVVKLRGSTHSKSLCLFDVKDDTISIGDPLTEFHGILTGTPMRININDNN